MIKNSLHHWSTRNSCAKSLKIYFVSRQLLQDVWEISIFQIWKAAIWSCTPTFCWAALSWLRSKVICSFWDSLFMYPLASCHLVIFSVSQSSKNGDLQGQISTEIGQLFISNDLAISPLHSQLIHHLFFFRVFGCVSYKLIRKINWMKLEP